MVHQTLICCIHLNVIITVHKTINNINIYIYIYYIHLALCL